MFYQRKLIKGEMSLLLCVSEIWVSYFWVIVGGVHAF